MSTFRVQHLETAMLTVSPAFNVCAKLCYTKLALAHISHTDMTHLTHDGKKGILMKMYNYAFYGSH